MARRLPLASHTYRRGIRSGLSVDSKFWAADRIPANLSDGAIMVFFNPQDLPGGYINHVNSFQTVAGAWCVRGGSGSQIQ